MDTLFLEANIFSIIAEFIMQNQYTNGLKHIGEIQQHIKKFQIAKEMNKRIKRKNKK